MGVQGCTGTQRRAHRFPDFYIPGTHIGQHAGGDEKCLKLGLTRADEAGRPGQVMAFQMRDASALDSLRPLGSTGGKSPIAYLSSGRDLSNGEVPAVFPGEFQYGAASEGLETADTNPAPNYCGRKGNT